MERWDEAAQIAEAVGLELLQLPEGLTLAGNGMQLRADFSRMLPRLRPGRLSGELLVKAAKVKGTAAPVAVDATAGFAEDSLLLAAAGFTVELFERDAVIAALLADALERAATDAVLAPLAARMRLHEEDSIGGMASLVGKVDVAYLDPMFPQRTKSAAVKKKFQLLHHLERPCEDEMELMGAALAMCPRKIVVKRPPKAPVLAGRKPSYQLTGKAVRYDVIVPPACSDVA